ncbi:MAG: hemolysin-like protein [Rhodospirillaceae bacterium]|nr:MAG: hemolysin-like protein [Rhodospirillaceae bacterium]
MTDVSDQNRPDQNRRQRDADDSSLIKAVSGWLKDLLKTRSEDSDVRDAIEDIIEERSESNDSIDEHERLLLSNVLHMHTITARDIMVPRVDIVAIEIGHSLKQVIRTMAGTGHSRLPVFRGTLDDVVGMVHIKDMMRTISAEQASAWHGVIRPVLFVAPSVRVMDLLLEMRTKRTHMALVVDEYGGIDGLMTIGDLVEKIVGRLADEHDTGAAPQFLLHEDGTAEADARVSLAAFERRVGRILSDEEREETHTLGGLVFSLAGRIPARGELISHPSGMAFEILEADPRRVKRLRVHNLPLEVMGVE